MMGVFFDCYACAEDPVSSPSIKMSVRIAADSEIPTEYVEFNCEKYQLLSVVYCLYYNYSTVRGKVNLDQEKGKVTNNAYMGVWG